VLSVRLEAERQLESTVVRRTAELANANAMLHEEIVVRARLENQLTQALQVEREAIAQQREFVAMVSHEFRTPLTAIDAAAQSLDISRVGAQPAVRSRTERIRRAVQRLTMLIENVMLADRLQSASQSMRLETIDIVELTRGLCDGFHVQSPSRIRLEVHAAAQVWVRADRALLDIALRNLVHNALKYSAAERPVVVVVETVAAGVHIDVTDQGEGIAAQDAPRIFEKYFRAESASRVPGTGLGLHLSRNIARLHGGDVELVATSEAGSVFRLRLPLSS